MGLRMDYNAAGSLSLINLKYFESRNTHQFVIFTTLDDNVCEGVHFLLNVQAFICPCFTEDMTNFVFQHQPMA